MTSYKASESKREEFRKYLEKAGVMDVLTKVLVGLYEEPEKPNDAVNYVKKLLNEGDAGAGGADETALKEEIQQLKDQIQQLMEENEDLKAKLGGHEEKSPTSTTAAQLPEEMEADKAAPADEKKEHE